MAHIRLVVKKKGVRFYRTPGHDRAPLVNLNLCGAEPTDRDWALSWAKKATAQQLEQWEVCRACLAKMNWRVFDFESEAK